MFGVELVEAGAPQIPALDLSLAMLAKFGPLFWVVVGFLMPALALAEDQRLPNASPDAFFAAGGLLPVEKGDAGVVLVAD